MNSMTKQAEFCQMMMERLAKSVAVREEAMGKKGEAWCGYDFQFTKGAGKYQLKADITRLRRELQRLSEMIEGG